MEEEEEEEDELPSGVVHSHTEMTRLSQPCDKVVTTMSTIDKVVTTLWIGCHYLVTRL